EGARRLRSRVGRRKRGGPGRRAAARPAARGGSRAPRLRRGGPAEARDRVARVGGSGRPGPVGARSAPVTPDLVYGRPPVGEAVGGPGGVLELWARARALAAAPWLADTGVRPQVKSDRDLSEAAGTRDHQGVLAFCEPYRYADAYELAASPEPLLVCL